MGFAEPQSRSRQGQERMLLDVSNENHPALGAASDRAWMPFSARAVLRGPRTAVQKLPAAS